MINKKKYFRVVKEFTQSTDSWLERTVHYKEDLDNRVRNLSKNTKLVKSFVVDKKHKNGLEVHSVYSSGEIVVYNLNSQKKITILFARPEQLKRLYRGIRKETPRYLLDKALENVLSNKNNL